VRDVRGVVYCENCLAEKLGVAPVAPLVTPSATGYIPVQGQYPPRSGGPNPGLAGILAGFFPFGVGAVYCGQYAKGLAHLVIFVILVLGWNQGGDWWWIFFIALGFFYVYQIIDSVRTAHAVQAGQPVPDPFGLASTFGGVDPRPAATGSVTDGVVPAASARIPTAAVVLIGLGVLFLLKNVGVFSFDFDRIWPFFLIGLGGWLIAVRLGYVGSRRFAYSRRSWTGPVVLITVGVLSLLESMGGPGWGRTWPVLLLAIGTTRLLDRSARPRFSPMPPVPPVAPPGADAAPPSTGMPPNEVNRG
jgi:hypothetical protein